MAETIKKTVKATTPSLKQWVQARVMTKAGFITGIISLETGLTQKQLRRLYSVLDKEPGSTGRNNHGSTRSGTTLIHSSATKIQASLMMQLYRNIGGELVEQEIVIDDLIKSFQMYHSIRNEIPNMKNGRWPSFSISDAWCLARELRSAEASLSLCQDCKCTFFTSIHQRTYIECPFCHDANRSTRNITQLKVNEQEDFGIPHLAPASPQRQAVFA